MPQAAAAAGISARTLRRWLARGRTQDMGPYRALLLACQEAAAAYDQRFAMRVGIADLTELVGALPAVTLPELEAVETAARGEEIRG